MGNRFIPSGVSKVVITPTVAGSSPTRAEINAGTVLATPGVFSTVGLKELSGFETDATDISVPDVSSKFDVMVPGRTTAKSPQIVMYDGDDSPATARSALAEGTNAVAIIMKYGDVAGERCECWPFRVSTIVDSQVDSGTTPATFTANVSITKAPSKNAVIPA